MTAYAFLLLSLYGAFLSYDAATDIIRTAPLKYLYGDQLVLPVLIQFWTLVIALVLLGVWLFRGSRKVMISGVIVMLSFRNNAWPLKQLLSTGKICRVA